MHTHQMSNIETGNLSRLNPLSLEKLLVICLVVFLIVLPSIVLPELIYPTQTGKSIFFFYGIAVLIGLGTVVLSAATISQNVSINSDSGKKAGLYQVSLTAMAQSEGGGGGISCTWRILGYGISA